MKSIAQNTPAQRIVLAMLAVLWVIALCSCAGENKEEARRCAQKKWSENRNRIELYMNDEPVGEEALAEALGFFDQIGRLSDITIRWNIVGTLDLLLFDEDTLADIKQVDSWYEEHQGNLRCTKDGNGIALDD